VKNNRTVPVPRHLRDTHYRGAKRLGHGEGYQYDHDAPEGLAIQDYLGVDKIYYEPTQRGREARVKEYLEKVRELRGQAKGDADDGSGS